ncbi:hypothetical protein MSG28_007042 [Choristoneura fumiferana]|uniref:Uncharacterized protein n=1 Tax=Choristoneura fumiferana TaxID=7141 RepID=A0ACC0JMC1_CHOFU|nr:hypothetical protein MSG28_007042 [Choristoneura fumiferana]
MAILLYDYLELEERAGRHLKVWKDVGEYNYSGAPHAQRALYINDLTRPCLQTAGPALTSRATTKLETQTWHIIIFAFAAVFGMLNYIFLQSTMYMVEDRCVLVAPTIEFTNVTVFVHSEDGDESSGTVVPVVKNETDVTETSDAQATTVAVPSDSSTMAGKTKKEADNSSSSAYDPGYESDSGHQEVREALDVARTFFGSSQDCEFAEYMPILATVFALVWTTLFVMCPGGGRSRTGLMQPWRILAPALIFALVLVGLTGNSFTRTNRGLREFCAAFYNYTNSTTCSSVNVYLERSWNATWKFGSRAEATRAASAGLWVCWAGAATLLIVRCLAAPDFQLMRTGVYLTKDPEQPGVTGHSGGMTPSPPLNPPLWFRHRCSKAAEPDLSGAKKVTPYLRKSRRRRAAASVSPSPNKSVRSEPTATTELVTASVESVPSSRTITPEPANEIISKV